MTLHSIHDLALVASFKKLIETARIAALRLVGL